jgi:hypothetical protein
MENLYTDELYGFETFYSYKELPNGLIVIDKPKEDNKYIVQFLAHGPKFDLIASALEDATYINHITGKPFIRTSILYRYLFTHAIVQINFPDNELMKSITVKDVDINRINYNLVKIICEHWRKNVL